MITLKALTKSFGALKAVDSLSLVVRPGDVLGFLGPNGAGKSTTMKMLTGFLAPTSGTASVFGHDIQSSPMEAKRLMGYLPEGAPLYGEMTVRAFLNFIADIRGMKGRQRTQRLNIVIDELQLSRVLSQRIETLSKGYKRRVGLAQAIMHSPKVLILDEPTDGLDPNQKHEVRELIRHMAHDKTIIISTHILEEVTAVCNRAAIIHKGRLVFDATPKDLAARSTYHQAIIFRLNEPKSIFDKLSALPDVELVKQESQTEYAIFPRAQNSALLSLGLLAQKEGWSFSEFYVDKGRLDEVFRELTG